MIEPITGINLTGKTLNEKLAKIAREEYGLDFDKFRFTVAFDKETDDEKVIEDARSLFNAIKNGEEMTPLFRVWIDKDGNRHSEVSEQGKRLNEVTEDQRESTRKLFELIKNNE